MPEETPEELKNRIAACHAEFTPILEKHGFEIGAQAFAYLEADGTIKVATKPVLLNIEAKPKAPDLVKP